MLLYIVYGILGLLGLVIVFFGITLVLTRNNAVEDEKPAVVEAEPEVQGGFFANERGNANLVVEKARLDGTSSGSTFFDDRLTTSSRNSIPARESDTAKKKDDDFTL